MDDRAQQIIEEKYFRFVNIPKKKQDWLMRMLEYTKEVRNTIFPLEDSLVTELEVVEFIARKDKKMYILNGSLALVDGSKFEARTFVAYVEPINEGETKVYLDITREGSENRVQTMYEDYQKKICTTETIIDEGDKVLIITSYNGNNMMGITYQEEVSKSYAEEAVKDRCKQLGAF